MDCSPPGFSGLGIMQARILEWVAISFSMGIFPTQGLNLGLLHCRKFLYRLSHQGSLVACVGYVLFFQAYVLSQLSQCMEISLFLKMPGSNSQ